MRPCPLLLAALGASLAGCFAKPERPSGDGGVHDGSGSPDAPATTIRMVQAPPKTSQGSTMSVAIDFADPPTGGDTIVLFTWSASSMNTLPAASGFFDSANNHYERVIADGVLMPDCFGGSGAVAIYVASPIAPSASPLHVTYTPMAGGLQEIVAVAVEYGGFAHSVPSVTSAMADTPGEMSPASWPSGTIPVGGPTLLVAVGQPCDAMTTKVGDDAGFTPRGIEEDSASHAPGIAADKIVTMPGSYMDSWTVTFGSSPQPLLGIIAALQ